MLRSLWQLHPPTQRLNNWKEGAVVYIQATAPEETFAIDFASTFQPNYHEDDLPFHMSVRPNDNEVVFNSKAKGSWEHQKIEPFRFDITGKDFCVAVCAQKQFFEVGVDSDFFYRFEDKRSQERKKDEMSVQLRNVTHIKRIAYHPWLLWDTQPSFDYRSLKFLQSNWWLSIIICNTFLFLTFDVEHMC